MSMTTSLIDFIPDVLQFLGIVLTISIPFILWQSFFGIWQAYVRQAFWNKQTPVMLEILLPKQIDKTPNAMELFLVNLNQTGGEGTWYDRNWLGKTRPWYSLEMVSIQGKVHFFIWTWASWKRFIETQLYAQYPGIEVTESKDYTRGINFNSELIGLWGCEMKLTKADAYPIKTYVDYGIGDDASKEEEVKVDPITPTIEYLGSVGQKQQVWMQFIVRAHKNENEIPLGDRWSAFIKKWGESNFNEAWKELWKKKDNWKEDAKAEIKKMKAENSSKIKYSDGTEGTGLPSLTKSQTEIINSLERSVSKPGFDVGIRAIYLAEKEFFDATYISGLTSVFKQYGSHALNGFAPKNTTSFDYPWQDFFGSGILAKKKWILNAYKARGYFYPPYKDSHIVLNSEELATVYHFPGQVVQTPSFDRVLSKKAEPPGNLPI